jgi:hypothetical protein
MLNNRSMVLFLFVLFMSCSNFVDDGNKKNETAAYHKVVKQASEKIQAKYEIKLSQVSGSVQPRFALIGLGFNHRGSLSKEEIRQIVVGSKEILITEMNSSKEWRPYLEEWGRYPCGSKDASIILFIQDERGDIVFHPGITVSASYTDMVAYRTKSPLMEYGYFEETEEPYEVALAIVRGEAQQGDCQPNPTAP